MQTTSQAKKQSLQLKKHVGLIHSTNKLSLLERKIANALLYNAYEKLLTQDEHVIHISNLSQLIGYNSKDFKTVKKSLISLMSTVLEWNLVDKDKLKDSTWVASTMLADAKIEGPICTYSYGKRMRELCYHPEFYGKLNMLELSQFKSTYGLALYENCIRYQNISQTPWFDLPVYRKLMGVKDGQYETFRDLNKRVIKPSIKEVNTYATICVEPEFRKQGRVVDAIRFKINKSALRLVSHMSNSAEANDQNHIENKLISEYGFSKNQVEDVLRDYSKEYVLEKIQLVESSPSYKNGKIDNLSKYLEKALIENFQPPKSSKENILQKQSEKKKKDNDEKAYQKQLDAFREYQKKQVFSVFDDSLSVKKRESILKAFEKHINSTVYSNTYSAKGLSDPMVKHIFGDFLLKHHQEILTSLLSFKEFCETKSELDSEKIA